MGRITSIICCCLLAHCVNAQLMDSIPTLLRHKYSVDARLESRYSFINHAPISVSGVRLGLAFERKLRIGGGLSWLNSDIMVDLPKQAGDQNVLQRNRYMKFVYVSYYVDFVFHKTKRWQLSVPIQAGTGLSWYQDYKPYRLRGNNTKYLLLLYEPGITAQFKVFKWAGLGADVAYRFTLKNNKVAESLNSPTYSFKILFWFDQLYYELFPESELAKKYGPAYW
jgi:hypothetical protein